MIIVIIYKSNIMHFFRISNIKPFIIIVFIYGIIDSNEEFKYKMQLKFN